MEYSYEQVLSLRVNEILETFTIPPKFTTDPCDLELLTEDIEREYAKQEREYFDARVQFALSNSLRFTSDKKIQESLYSIIQRLNEADKDTRRSAEEWLNTFYCDDPNQFSRCSKFLDVVNERIVKIIIDLLKKFTNTRKHSKRVPDEHGNEIKPDLLRNSDLTSPTYPNALFKISEEEKELSDIVTSVNNIFLLIREISEYALSVIEQAELMKKIPEACVESFERTKRNLYYTLKYADIEKEASLCSEADRAYIMSHNKQQLAVDKYHVWNSRQFVPVLAVLKLKEKWIENRTFDEEAMQLVSKIKDPVKQHEAASFIVAAVNHYNDYKSSDGKKMPHAAVAMCLVRHIAKNKYDITNTALYEYFRLRTQTKVSRASKNNYFSKPNFETMYYDSFLTETNTLTLKSAYVNCKQGNPASSVSMTPDSPQVPLRMTAYN